ncbi:phosphoribosylformylglycinamidine synthase [Kandleria vitulina]|uniref:Phosphoribosylformylglycinamidine synthase n=1 Tax=Kandleria vitulina TaxID=1630 RepID=A0A1H2RNA2_9FIRM|nr:phosphoribosylformylglycinamidine synthase [Kandleria vitulina]SDW20099.1 phosphoribosylformylglycinamidine synthase [Kandleria vitulina]
MSQVCRVYVAKREENAVEAKSVRHQLRHQLDMKQVEKVTIINRYDLQGLSEEVLQKGINTILSEPMVDNVYLEDYPHQEGEVIAIEYLPGQYDVRADFAAQCFQLLTEEKGVKVKCARLYIIEGITKEDVPAIENFLINPVDSRLASLEKPETLEDKAIEIKDVPVIEGFRSFNKEELSQYIEDNGMAMNYDDLKVTQDYFVEEQRDPTETELKVLDTYWSDHCRHTTFGTVLTDIHIEDGAFKTILEKDIENYKASRHLVYGVNTTRPLTLMDLGTIGMKELRKRGYLDDMEVSEEINACSVELKVHTDQGDEDWLLMFKNETHNHPTEIEPFGGAATCLGGCIRDPLSGRAYVYQSMRITGAGDPRQSLKDTMKGKLPQRKICREAAQGFSSYGNQIGLTTGYVHEIYDQGYVAKRMELGAVVAAAPKKQVKRLEPENGQIVLLIGGRTGRDGIGGATGSSKKHELKTTETAGAEVQKGNPVEERKIQRLFRNGEFSEKIVRCNDFGAGGVSVAIGELADGLDINLDAVPKKYEGLNGTELAISESQERMAIVINKEDLDFMLACCADENLEATYVADVTDKGRLTMRYQGKVIVDLSREFLNKNGAKRYQDVNVPLPDFSKNPLKVKAQDTFKATSKEVMTRLSVASQKGLVERFDSSIGNGTVLSPYGGKTFRTETEAMAALIPVLGKETTTCSLMSYGYNPKITEWSPYHGAISAVVESVAKIVAMGGDYHKIRFSFQEFFQRLMDNPTRWGQPFAALLGAYRAQKELLLPSIGGKDSMSGTFENIDVPPTFVSFAVTGEDVKHIISPEWKEAGHTIVEVMIPKDEFGIFDFDALKKQYDAVLELMRKGIVKSAYTIKDGGLLEAIYKSAFGNKIGLKINEELTLEDLIEKNYGHMILEVEGEVTLEHSRVVGQTIASDKVIYKDEEVMLDDIYAEHTAVLEDVYPTVAKAPTDEIKVNDTFERGKAHASKTYDEVKVVIPAFPGTNCEYDSARAFKKAGGTPEIVLIKNTSDDDIKNSINALAKAIDGAQIMMIPGGFSASDEPEGSGKFIATVLRNPKIKEAIEKLLDREGLIIGICNGFQALVKVGLLPDGVIRDMTKDDATLTFNTIGRHVSQMVKTRISSVKSPWLANVNVGDTHIIPVSHGEGRFVANKEVLDRLIANGQVFSQYVDENDEVTMKSPFNPNGSMYGIEGILSEDGRVIGKMGHSERQGDNRNINIYGDMDQKLFESGVAYFK